MLLFFRGDTRETPRQAADRQREPKMSLSRMSDSGHNQEASADIGGEDASNKFKVAATDKKWGSDSWMV